MKELSPILEIKDEILLEKFKDKMNGIELWDKISQEKAEEIDNLKISGLDLFKYSQRIYPQGSFILILWVLLMMRIQDQRVWSFI